MSKKHVDSVFPTACAISVADVDLLWLFNGSIIYKYENVLLNYLNNII